MNMLEHYRNLFRNSELVFDAMVGQDGLTEELIGSHNYLLDYDVMRMAISGRPEVAVFDSALKEYQFAMFALVAGQYRHAFGGLRLFFELMLSTIQFSAHEIDYRMWAQDSKDIVWSALKDTQCGIFSKNFIRAFNVDFSDYGKQYGAIAEVVYRECSEFVHGNAATHLVLPSQITFNKELFNSWNQKAKAMRLVIIFAFAARYVNYIDLDATHRMEPILSDVLGNLQPVQTLFSKSPGVK